MLIETNTQKALAFLFRAPGGKWSVRQLAGKLGISVPATSSIVRRLRKAGYVTVEKSGAQYIVRARPEAEPFRELKMLYNLWNLRELKRALIKKFEGPKAVVVFGSYSSGEDSEASDVNIAVIAPRKARMDLSGFEKSLGRKIRLFVFPSWRPVPASLRAGILNGVKLYGAIRNGRLRK